MTPNPFLTARLLAMLIITMTVATGLSVHPDSVGRLFFGGLCCFGAGLLFGPRP